MKNNIFKNVLFFSLSLTIFLVLFILPLEIYAEDDPSTIVTGYGTDATRIEQQRKVFRNPRGQLYYYALIETADNDWYFYKSSDGTSWSSTGVLVGGVEPILTPYKPPSLWVWEDNSNSRLILWVVFYFSNNYIYVECFKIDDTATDPSFLWRSQVAAKTDDAVHNPTLALAGNGYVWVAWVDEYTYRGKQRADIYVRVTNTTNPTSSPSWSPANKAWDGINYKAGTDITKVTLVPLTATANVGILWTYYDGTDYPYTGKTGSYSGSGSPTFGSSFLGIITDSLKHSAVAESGTNSDVFSIHWHSVAGLRVWKWDVSANSRANFGTLFSGNVDSFVLAIDKTSSPDKLYAFYVKNGVAGKVFYKTTGVDSVSWSSEQTISDDTESLDYLSASYEDWNKDGKIQIIYTQQTSKNVRFVEAPLPCTQDSDCGSGKFCSGGDCVFCSDYACSESCGHTTCYGYTASGGEMCCGSDVDCLGSDACIESCNSFKYCAPPSRWLSVNLLNPFPDIVTEVDQYSNFDVNATVMCQTDPTGYDCGDVYGLVRYNSSGTEPNKLIDTTPFYITSPEKYWSDREYLSNYAFLNYQTSVSGVATESEYISWLNTSTRISKAEMNANGNQNVNFSISLSPSIEQINLSYALWQVGTNNWDWATFNISMYNYSDSSWVSLYNTTITWPGENCQVTKFPLKIDSDFRNGNIVNISLRMKEYDSSPGAVAYTTGTYSCDGESVSFTNKGHSFVWSRIYLYRGNTQFCGILEDGGPSCQLNWTVNATGDTLPQVRAIDVNFSSSMAAVSPADTANAYVKIVSLNPPSYEYTILMPSGYTCPEDCFVITAPSETEANKTDWITFNTSDTASDVQPWRGGIQTNAQSGLKKPIILVKNTGSVKINLTIRLNESLPSGSALYYYSTCVYPCTGRVKEQMTTNYQTVIKGLSPGGYANITLWLDTSNAPFGTYIRKVFINATAT